MSYTGVLKDMNMLMYIQRYRDDNQLTLRNMKTKQLILRELLEVIELWPEINISQHIVSIMRPYKDAYHWTDEMLLKKIDKYRDELETDGAE